MEKNSEQRVCLKFCVLNEISCAESLRMLQKAYGESVLSKTQVYEWYKAFKDGRETVEDAPRSGRPSTSTNDDNVEKVKEIVLENRHTSVRELGRYLNMSRETARLIIVEKLGMRRVAARLVPIQLNFLQKQYRMQIAMVMLDRANSDPNFMGSIITGDACKQVNNRPNGVKKRAETEKTTPESLKNQDDAHCFLRYSWCGAS